MKKLLSKAVAVGIIASTTIMPIAYADVAATALPTLNTATNAKVTTNNAKMNIEIQGGKGAIGTMNWKTYNVGKNAHVNYEFSANNQTAFNKVDAAGGLSQIYGKITNSGCNNCTYAGTGKVILLNPNGVLFGTGANVDLNSFTVSTMNGTLTEANKLKLTKGTNQKEYGIKVYEGAKIYGDKNVALAANNVTIHKGSQISTNVGNNVGDTAYGKVKIITSDGVTFNYYNNGAIESLADVKTSANKMTLSVDRADIQSGHIDIRNMSSHKDSELNINGATLKATKAVKGNDGNIWLTASNKIVDEGAKLTTVNMKGAESKEGGNVRFLAGQKVSVGTNDIDAVGNVDFISQGHDVALDNSTVDTAKDVTLNAKKVASIQNKSVVNANNVNVIGGTRAQVANSTVNAKKDVNLTSSGDMVYTTKATINAGNDINVTASNGYVQLQNSNYTASRSINIKAKDNITSADLEGSKFTTGAGTTIESTAESIILNDTTQFEDILIRTGVSEPLKSLKAAKNVEINYNKDLTVGYTDINAGKDVHLTSKEGIVTVVGPTIKAGNNVYITSNKKDVELADTVEFAGAKKIYVTAGNDVKTVKNPFVDHAAVMGHYDGLDTNKIQTNIKAGNDVNVTLLNVDKRENGLVAEAGRNMKITTPGTLSVSSLISGNDMEINAPKVIAGLPYTKEKKLPGDPNTERSYIEVGGTFTSNVTTDNYEITESGDLTPDGNFNKKHHIQYGSDEKILLVNKRPVDNKITDPDLDPNDNGDEIDVIKPGKRPTPSDPTPAPVNPDPVNPDPVNPDPVNPDPVNPDPVNPDPVPCDGDPARGDNATDEENPNLI